MITQTSIRWRYYISGFILLYSILLAEHVQASGPYATSGWFVPYAEEMPDDAATCGPNATVGQIELRELDSTPKIFSGATLPVWSVTIYDDDKETVLYNWRSTSGDKISPKFCYQASSDYILVDSEDSGGSSYYKHQGVGVSIRPKEPDTYYGKSFKGYLYVLPKIEPTQTIDPKVSMDSNRFQTITDTILTLHGSTEIYETIIYTTVWGEFSRTQRRYSDSDGAGTRIFTDNTLPDGLYRWNFFHKLDGQLNLSDGRTISGTQVSGVTKPAFSLFDNNPPRTTVVLKENSRTSTKANVTITNYVEDFVSGLSNTVLHIDKISPDTGKASQVTTFPSNTRDQKSVSYTIDLDIGATYEYYAVTTDIASNVSTSTTRTYLSSDPLTLAMPPRADIDDSYSSSYNSYFVTYGDSNNISLNAEAFDSDNVSIPVADVDWRWTIDSCSETANLYSVEQAFSTSTVNNRLIPSPEARHIYLSVRDKNTGLWSDNCPYVEIRMLCPEGKDWSGYDCIDKTEIEVDFVSENPTVSQGPYYVGKPISFDATVRNIGRKIALNYDPQGLGNQSAAVIVTDWNDEVFTDSGFSDNFSYSWNGTNWTDITPFIKHKPLSVDSTRVDSLVFTPSQTGLLYLQHCVDSFNEIDELGYESPNCSVVGQLTITDQADLDGLNCSISNTSNSCDTPVSWNIRGAVSPNVYNQTTDTVYSTDSIGTDVMKTIVRGNNVIQARDGDTVLKTINLSAYCDSSTFWEGSACVELPQIDIVTPTDIIRYDTPTAIDFNIDSTYDLTCTIYGLDSTDTTLNHTGSPSTQKYSFTTKVLTSTQKIRIDCPIGGEVATEDIRIEVLPKFEEL